MISKYFRTAASSTLLLTLAACGGTTYDNRASVTPRSTVVSVAPSSLPVEGLESNDQDGDFYGYVSSVDAAGRTITIDAVSWDDSMELNTMRNAETGTRTYGLGGQLTNAVEVELRVDGLPNDSESYDLDETDEAAAFVSIIPELLRSGEGASTMPTSVSSAPASSMVENAGADKLFKFTVDDGRVTEIEPVEPDGNGTDE